MSSDLIIPQRARDLIHEVRNFDRAIRIIVAAELRRIVASDVHMRHWHQRLLHRADELDPEDTANE